MSAKPTQHDPDDAPAAPCITVDEIKEIRTSLHEIKLAIVGQPELGNKGVIPRLKSVEEQVEDHDRKLLRWGTTISIIGAVIIFAKDAIAARFFK